MTRLTSEQQQARRPNGKFGSTRAAADDQTADARAALVADTLASITGHGHAVHDAAPFDPNDYLNVGFKEIAAGMEHPDWDEEAVIEAKAQDIHGRGTDYRTLDQLRTSAREQMDTARWVGEKDRKEQAFRQAEQQRIDGTDWDQTLTDEYEATQTARQQLQDLRLSNPPTAEQTEAYTEAFKATRQHQKALVEAAHIVAKRDDPDGYDRTEVQQSLPVDHDLVENDTLLGRASIAVMYLNAAERTDDPKRRSAYFGSVQAARDGRFAENDGHGWPCPNCPNFMYESDGHDHYCGHCDD